MRKSSAAALLAVLLSAIAVRLSPLWSFLYWGSDTGEYFWILRSLTRTGHVSTTYYGWGVTYPYFPGTFFAQTGLAQIGGIDVPTVLNLLVPVLGAFAVVPMFLIAGRITKDARLALFAAAFLAGAIPHAYTTAHAAPATLGDLLALSGLLLFLRLRIDRIALIPLVLITGALITTHHLSLYFFLVMVLGAILVRGLARPWTAGGGTWREIGYAAFLVLGTFAYWLGYAATFRDSILPDVNVRPWWLLLAAFPLGLAILAGLIYARAKIRWHYRPSYPGFRQTALAYLAAVGTIFVIGVVTVWVGVPGTNFRVPLEGLWFFAPLALLMSFAASGRKFLDFLRDGVAPNAWLAALLLSAVVGIVAAPRVLVPYRHMEYLMVPFAILAGVGFFRLLDFGRLRGRTRNLTLAVGALLLGVNLLAGIPPASTFAGWQEGTVPAAVDVAYWARGHAAGLVVSDHQGSTTVFGFGGINASWDRTRDPFLLGSAGDPYAGLRGIPAPSGLKDATYVWIDRDMESGVRLAPWESADPMDRAVIAKFDDAPFIKVFDNGYARMLWIAWGCTRSTC